MSSQSFEADDKSLGSQCEGSGSLSQTRDITAWERKFLAEDGTEDPTINRQPIEAYLYYATRERLREENDYRPIPDAPWTVLWKRLSGEGVAVTPTSPGQASGGASDWLRNSRGPSDNVPSNAHRLGSEASHSHGGGFIDDQDVKSDNSIELALRSEEGFIITPHERETAYRIMRVSSWQVVFYLIFSDMSGWYQSSQAFSILGYGPGILVYTVFWLMALCCGQMLWKLYMSLDSERYPVKSYGDLCQRTIGPWFRTLVNIGQFLLFLMIISTLGVINGHALSMLITYKFCFLGYTALFSLGGLCLTQFRTLRNISALTYLNFFFNVIVVCLVCYATALFEPTPLRSLRDAGRPNAPIFTSAWIPPYSETWGKRVVGVQIVVFGYGGCVMFTEFMAEMRRPRDFWKAAILAQLVLYIFYMFSGLFVYSMQGQYTSLLPINNVVNKVFVKILSLCTVVITLMVGIMYAHIGCKMVYRYIFRRFGHRPSLSSPRSRVWWCLNTCAFWILVWVIAAAIPNMLDLTTLISSLLIMPLTYIVPPILLVAHWVQRDALSGDAPWRPGMEPYSNRIDTWWSFSRWKRGFLPYWYLKLFIFICTILGLTLMILSMWVTVFVLNNRQSINQPFACTVPHF